MGNKPANSPKGHPPDADGHSSVSDLANSLTGDMVMVGRCVCGVGYAWVRRTLLLRAFAIGIISPK